MAAYYVKHEGFRMVLCFTILMVFFYISHSYWVFPLWFVAWSMGAIEHMIDPDPKRR